tara:strand:- start:251 stop:616 length:366 start_codon:yes stop_codon:yes gene_type:complete
MARNERKAKTRTFSDEELTAALSRFNRGVSDTREYERSRKAIAKAEKVRNDAAAEVKRLLDMDVSAQEREAAENSYREALQTLQSLSNSGDALPIDTDGEVTDADESKNLADVPEIIEETR